MTGLSRFRPRLGLRQLLVPAGWAQVQHGRAFRRRYPGGPGPLATYRALLSSRLVLVPAGVDLLAGPLVDVGANVGDWTAAALTALPGAQVIALEPAEQPLRTLRDRFAAHPRVTILSKAASDAVGTSTFHVTAHSHNSSLHRPRDMNADYVHGWDEVAAVEVETTTLDDALAGVTPSLVKIDVQGAELAVLAGAADVLRRTSAVLLEVTTRSHYEGDAGFAELHDRMTALGFRLANLSEPYRNAAGEALWFDACYLRGQ